MSLDDDTRPPRLGRRVCVVGDALVAGVGDARSLGWTGRVGARTPQDGVVTTMFPLGVPGEGTAGLLGRWIPETSLRWHPEAENRLVVGLGRSDIDQGTSLARSRLNLANILDEAASRGVRSMAVGPPPTLDGSINDRLAELSTALQDVCERRGVPYVDCYSPLSSHEQWYADLAAGDGTHPGQAGYGLLAWLVLHGGWYAWLGVPQP